MNYKLDFETQYNQFYISDKAFKGDTGSDVFWTDEAHYERLALAEDVAAVGIQCYGHVRGEVSLLNEAAAEIDYDKYDHIVEGGIAIKSGVLQLLDCPNSGVELTIKVAPGMYRIRIYSLNLAGVDVNDDEGDDYYKIDIWPDGNMERKVVKQYGRE